MERPLSGNCHIQFLHIIIIDLNSDGQPVSGSDYEEKSNGNERTLFVKNCKDSGEYTVQCGNDKMSAKLKVNGASEPAAPAPEPEPAKTAAPPVKTEEPKPQAR